MDFFDIEENELTNNFIHLDSRTSDIKQQDNMNSRYVLSKLSDFKNMDVVSPELMNSFIYEINQRIIWENIILYGDPFTREPFKLVEQPDYDMDVPEDYFDTCEQDSMVDAIIKFVPRYLQQKYSFFDFSPADLIIERMQHFNVSKYYIKLLVMIETLLPLSLKKFLNEILDMFGEISLKEKINKVKDKAYIGMLWNMSEAYLSKCDPDIYSVFMNQSWDFIDSYIKKNI